MFLERGLRSGKQDDDAFGLYVLLEEVGEVEFLHGVWVVVEDEEGAVTHLEEVCEGLLFLLGKVDAVDGTGVDDE